MFSTGLFVVTLTLSSAVLAFPGANRSDAVLQARLEVNAAAVGTYPVYADPPAAEGPWVGCEFGDDACGCTNAITGLEHYCGYVDPAWVNAHHHAGRRLEELYGVEVVETTVDDPTLEEDGPFPEPIYPSADGTAINIGRVRRLGRRDDVKSSEIIKHAKFPLMAALTMVGFKTAHQYIKGVIRTKLPKETQGKYVQGITGTLGTSTTLRGKGGELLTFAKEAIWEIRWDFSGLKSDGSLPESGILGPHVNMVVQDSVHRQKWAFYFPKNSVFYKMAEVSLGDTGESYLHGIVEGLTNVAGYNFHPTPVPQPVAPATELSANVLTILDKQTHVWQLGDEFKSAVAIGAKWLVEFTAYRIKKEKGEL
ncbi:MAG: hypothetical protein M1817_003909 [Caeruleum heppii]|nr:MAG: hypothetical protein M1817_003909 [Caeruleum heppii]